MLRPRFEPVGKGWGGGQGWQGDPGINAATVGLRKPTCKAAEEARSPIRPHQVGKLTKCPCSLQAMMGKTFGGDAFLASPAVVEFKDFNVGQTYSLKVAITNRAYAKNTFRVLEVCVRWWGGEACAPSAPHEHMFLLAWPGQARWIRLPHPASTMALRPPFSPHPMSGPPSSLLPSPLLTSCPPLRAIRLPHRCRLSMAMCWRLHTRCLATWPLASVQRSRSPSHQRCDQPMELQRGESQEGGSCATALVPGFLLVAALV